VFFFNVKEGRDYMESDWDKSIDSLSKIKVFSNPNNEPVTISGDADDLKCIGIGTDAAVFQSLSAPAYAFKLYAKDKVNKVKVEANVYQILGDSPFFSTCFASYEEYLVLSYEEGKTLFDCILQGIHIPEQVINDVEDAREYVRNKGLNPRDIHLKNILLQNGRAKIIDVSEYVLPGNDFRWEHLKKGYEQYYHLIDGNSVPFWLVETIRKWYNQRGKNPSSYEEFTKTILKLLYKK
jgi:serine/threonine protein kinase